MDLGNRLKQARLESGLSQRQLCGDEITRNMLSQIENGSARPSMDTLRYLAARLGKPISFFLEETAASPNQNLMEQARKAYAAGDFTAAMDILKEYQSPDSVFDAECYLLQALILLSQAESETDSGHARELLHRAAEAGAATPYYTPELERRRLLCLAKVSPENCALIADALPSDDQELLLRARAAMETGNIPRCIALLDAAQDQAAPDWLLLRGDAAMLTGDCALAGELYHRVESLSPAQAYPKLEQYYLQMENYKMAYLYACKQR